MNDNIRETALKYAVAFCGYEYEMPYVHEEQVVWADSPETALNAIDNYDFEELKSIVTTKQELT